MPLYEYNCHRCGKTFEVLQRFSDQPLTEHEGCGGEVEKLISTSAFQFKGSGWYATDYARGGGKSRKNGSNGASEAKSDAPKTESKTESKSDSKSESKSESKPAPAKTSD